MIATHIALHYLRQNRTEGDLKSIILLGSMGAFQITYLSGRKFSLTSVRSIMGSYPRRVLLLSSKTRRARPHALPLQTLHARKHPRRRHPPFLRSDCHSTRLRQSRSRRSPSHPRGKSSGHDFLCGHGCRHGDEWVSVGTFG